MFNFEILIFIMYFIIFGKLIVSTILNIGKLITNAYTSLKGLNLREELYNLSPREFELWCGEFLKSNNYNDVLVSNEGPDCGIDIRCSKNDSTIYIECKRYNLSECAKYQVDENTVKKLLGAMVADGVCNGLIITTGCITQEAVRFINTLPEELSIKYYDGNSFNISLNSFELEPTVTPAN